MASGFQSVSLKDLLEIRKNQEGAPNRFTRGLGEQVKYARDDASLSQMELAAKMQSRQSTVSDIEHGKVEIGAITLAVLACILRKPIDYFFPEALVSSISADQLSSKEKELVRIYRDLAEAGQGDFALGQLKFLHQHRRNITTNL